MTNSTPPPPMQLHGRRSPFGDEDPSPAGGNRLPGILAGNEQLLMEAAVHMVLVGGAICYSSTRDGGAISVIVFYGRERFPKYAASPEALSALLEAVSHWEPAQPLNGALRPSVKAQARR